MMGKWIDIIPKDGSFDEVTEEFDIELEEMSVGMHTLSVRAIDSSGNDTDSENKIMKIHLRL